jgi:hypothetical protein
MARATLDRSAGRCESFRGIAGRDRLAYLAARYDHGRLHLHADSDPIHPSINLSMNNLKKLF